MREIVSNWWFDALLGGVVTFVAMRLGRVLLTYRNEYQPVASFFQPEASTGFSAIYQILFAPVAMVFAAIGLYVVGWNQLIHGLWTVSVWYFIWQTSLILAISRWRLLDKPKFFLFHTISIATSYFVYATLITRGIEHLLPDEAGLRTEVWLIVILFLYGIFREIRGNQAKYERRQATWARAHARNFSRRYSATLSEYPVLLQEALLSVMVYEDFNRPKAARLLERVSRAQTQTIMQVQGARTDEEGIRMTASSLEFGYPALQLAIDQGKKQWDLYPALTQMVRVHNSNDPDYEYRVAQVFVDIHGELSLTQRTSATP